MYGKLRSKKRSVYALCLLAIALCFVPAMAQSEDETDPIKLFEKGQDAHARNDFKRAIEFYDAAIKLKPEFPEAEFQRAMALLARQEKSRAMEGFNRAIAQRPNWALAYAKFGSFLVNFRNNIDTDAEPFLRKAIELDEKNLEATVALAVLLHRRNAPKKEAVELIRAATALPDATFQTWWRRARLESGANDLPAAMASISRAIDLNPTGVEELYRDRARLRLQMNDRAGALADLQTVKSMMEPTSNFTVIVDVALLFGRAGSPDEGLRLLDGLKEADQKLPEVISLRAELASDTGSSPELRAALEELLKRTPNDPTLLARLGSAYRRSDPLKSQDYYYRALQIDSKNPKYATGYAAALIQQRKFAEAEPILKRVIALTPDDYVAHANLALALYEMKRFAEALPEYEWVAAAKPEIAATYFFIATAHDNLGEYQQALDAYEKFLSRADPANHKLEIDKVNLRLPTLRAQIKRGEGMKQKRP